MFSVMNYNYQINGVRKDGKLQYIYSDISCNGLPEYALIEPAGFSSTLLFSSLSSLFSNLINIKVLPVIQRDTAIALKSRVSQALS